MGIQLTLKKDDALTLLKHLKGEQKKMISLLGSDHDMDTKRLINKLSSKLVIKIDKNV